MREVRQDLGLGEVVRTIIKTEFGRLVLSPNATIDKHGHFDGMYDGKFMRHAEIYFTLSRKILVNGKYRRLSICSNSKHEAMNISPDRKGTIFFLKLWW